MTTAQSLVFAGVMVWVMWLIWSGRENGPRRRRDRARWEALLEEAVRKKREEEKHDTD